MAQSGRGDSVGEHLRCAVNRVKKSLALTILRNVCGQLSNPGRGFSSPPVENIKEKSPYFRTGSHLEYGGEGGIDSLRSPLLGPSMGLAPAGPTQALFKNAPGVFVGAARLLRARSVQLALPVVEPRSGVLIPPVSATCEKKARTCVRALLKIWR
ncbi:TPA: hypothetical protein MHW59_17205 [Klebsiella pneumoniae]|nr:hypothetical protein [Klebsiella pneumoniae]HBX3236994.1 hypothetical protein [Klebsiella pneumoniae]HBX3315558.1 hypothetical protein [Klebsiella pneumoniae]HBX3320939.1 hypothetical protein [Klebsiella pneumoniae]HBX3331936.1 hypothetical protein [Klebsiella pneumoniae]